MKIIDLKHVNDSDVIKWMDEHLKLTSYQKEKIRNDEMIRFVPFYFMERRKKTNNILLRFSIIFMFPVTR